MQTVNTQPGVPRVVCCKPDEKGKYLANKVYGCEEPLKRDMSGFYLSLPRSNRDTWDGKDS